MLVYMAYDKKTGRIFHVHRAVDSDGRSLACTDEEVLSTLPAGVDRQNVGVIATSMDAIPSGRVLDLRVDVASGTLKKTQVQAAEGSRRR